MVQAEERGGGPSWPGTPRYEVIRCIGRGGMGAVYEAFDRERARRLAVKTLVRFDPGALYLFKQEFRTLTNLLHPNLVRLYDLVASESEGVFFTMELVSGVHFSDWVTRSRVGAHASPVTTASGSAGLARASSPSSRPPPSSGPPPSPSGGSRRTPADLGRLRAALHQLALGVQAVHAAGKVHRDIKPSNVLVEEDGRVVLLDFGIAAELSGAVERRTREANVVGTPAYMAPEQAVEGAVTAAADWYSVGAMLYEALVGRPPFAGDMGDVVYRKAVLDPPAPREVAEGIPEDLDALCCDLLQRDPGDRPTGARVLRRLGVERRALSPTPIAGFELRPSLVGRSAELRALHQAYVRVRTGGSAIVRVRGASGLGKSALVRHFLDGLATRTDALVLRGCAYERESVAYKGVDGAVDALSRCLVALDQRGEKVALPAESRALAHLFPVLRRVPGIAGHPEPGRPRTRGGDDPHQLRQRAFRAFRDILTELARIGPTVLHLDDVQWGDVDSAMLLLDVMRPPDPPPVLLILGHRDGPDAEASPFLRHLAEHGLAGFDVRDVPIEPLSPEEARQLALRVLGADDEATVRVAEAIALGSGGSAFFVEDLARSAKEHGLGGPTPVLVAGPGSTLEGMLQGRIDRLAEGPRRLLDLASIHGRPVPAAILERAAGAGEVFEAQLGELRARHYLRLVTREGQETVETTHDRIRETAAARLSPAELRAGHARLAAAYEAEPEVDAEAVALHWFAAGEPSRAVVPAERAAQQASEKLAFDRAAHLYRRTLAALPADSEDAARVRVRLAEALAWAGRGAESARLYLEAARTAPDEERTSLERAGANELLMCGAIDEGARILRRTLASVGRGAPESPWVAFGWLVVYGAWLRVRGLRVRAREAEEVPARMRAELEALYGAVTGLALSDAIVGAALLARLLTLALWSRSRLAIIAAALLRANQLATRGGPETRYERELVALADRLAGPADAPDRAEQAMRATLALRSFVRGRWREAFESLESAFTTLPASRERWNIHALAVFAELALVYMGEIEALSRRLPALFADAEQRGDLMKFVNLSMGVVPIVCLAHDDPGTARKHIVGALARWPQQGFLLQHWRALVAQVDVDLYEGYGARAASRLAREAQAIRRAFLQLVQYVRAITGFARARSAVAASFEAVESRSRHLREARRHARALASEKAPWIDALAALASAALANAQGDRASAIRHLQDAARLAEAAEMALYALAARVRLESLDPSAGSGARAAMQARGVRSPDRFTGMLLPGRWPSDEP